MNSVTAHYEAITTIAAPMQDVWTVFTDFAEARWNPMFTLSTRPVVGQGTVVRLKTPLPLPIHIPVTVDEFSDTSLRWHGGVRLGDTLELGYGEHYFQIEPASEGCRFIHGEFFRGPATRLLPLLRPVMKPQYEAMNLALAREVARVRSGAL